MTQTAKPNFGIRAVTFLLSLVLFFSVLGGIFVAGVRIVTDKDNLSRVIREALFSAQTVRPARVSPAGSGAPRIRTQANLAPVQYGSDASDMTGAMVDWIYEMMEEEYGGELPISLETVQEFVEESTLKDELSDIAASLISDFYTGENTTVIDASTVERLLQENAPLIEVYFGYTITQGDIDMMAQVIVENDYIAQIQQDGIAQVFFDSINSSGSDVTTGGDPTDVSLAETLTTVLETFRAYTSDAALYGCIAAAAVCAVLIILLNLKWIHRALRCIGTPMLLGALPYFIPAFTALVLTEQRNELLSFSTGARAAITTIVELTAPVSIGVFSAGVALCIAAVVVRIVIRNRADVTKEFSDALTEPTAE